MCPLTGVTSGPIQPGKEDSQVRGECGDRTPGLRLLHGRVHILQGVGNKVLLLFLPVPASQHG